MRNEAEEFYRHVDEQKEKYNVSQIFSHRVKQALAKKGYLAEEINVEHIVTDMATETGLSSYMLVTKLKSDGFNIRWDFGQRDSFVLLKLSK